MFIYAGIPKESLRLAAWERYAAAWHNAAALDRDCPTVPNPRRGESGTVAPGARVGRFARAADRLAPIGRNRGLLRREEMEGTPGIETGVPGLQSLAEPHRTVTPTSVVP